VNKYLEALLYGTLLFVTNALILLGFFAILFWLFTAFGIWIAGAGLALVLISLGAIEYLWKNR